MKGVLFVLVGLAGLMIADWTIQKVGGFLADATVAIWERWSPSPREKDDRRLTVIVVLVLIAGLAIVWLDGELHPGAQSTNCIQNYLGRDCD